MKIFLEIQQKVNENLRIKNSWLTLSFVLLFVFISIFYILFFKGGNFIQTYVYSQKELFLYLNSELSKYPLLQLNLTQLGDVLTVYSFLAVLIYYSPKFWRVLLTSSIITLVVSGMLKKLFAVPRPAAMFDLESFTVLGRVLSGKTSFPSGHSMVTFVVISLVIIAFMPKNKYFKILWSISLIVIGLLLAFSRVGVGAHYPIDVLAGCYIGYLILVVSIKIDNKFKLWKL